MSCVIVNTRPAVTELREVVVQPAGPTTYDLTGLSEGEFLLLGLLVGCLIGVGPALDALHDSAWEHPLYQQLRSVRDGQDKVEAIPMWHVVAKLRELGLLR